MPDLSLLDDLSPTAPNAGGHRHVLSCADLDDDAFTDIINAAVAYKRSGNIGAPTAPGKALGMVFFNPSLRTRTSMERAAQQIGAHATTLVPGSGTWNFAWADGAVMDGDRAEHVRDAMGVLSRYYDALGVRVFATGTDHEQDASDALIRQIAEAATVPVVSLESAWHHPCQALADAAVLHERFDGTVAGKRFVLRWAPHPKALPMAVPNSALLMAARCGMDVTVARPNTHALDASVMKRAEAYAARHGTTLRETDDPAAAAEGADVVYVKSWGGPLVYTDPEQEAAARAQHADWCLTEAEMATTRDGAFLHCLPIRRNVVAEDAVLDGPHALHLDQAEYRLHAQRALLEYVWNA